MRHFYQNVALKLAPPFIRMLVQAAIRMGKQLCFMGYYNDERVFESVGYKRFSKREDTAHRLAKLPLRPRKHLSVLKEIDINTDEITADVVIAGSGPGASVLAKGLIEAGRTVLMVERGDYTDPSQFNEDEIDMVSKLYADGALQLARDFQFQVIQGSCVGGSSVVNNAVCFDTPNNVLDRWNDITGLNAGLDPDRYKNPKPMVELNYRNNFYFLAIVWALLMFSGNYLLYRLGVMSFLPWLNNFVHCFLWIGICLTWLYYASHHRPWWELFLHFSFTSFIIKMTENKILGTWHMDSFLGIDSPYAYIIAMSLVDGFYPLISKWLLKFFVKRSKFGLYLEA